MVGAAEVRSKAVLRGVWGGLVTIVAVALLASRASALGSSDVDFLRFAGTSIAIAVVALAPWRSFVRGALLAMVVEVVAGSFAFVSVDLPLLRMHRGDITRLTVHIAHAISNFGR